ncbi:MAG: FAD-dependent oxidoreductase, partial [Gaiellaceae bacterium]|nr:FAD-dependent oxidoreductase [Gaiellaceae bacterium]
RAASGDESRLIRFAHGADAWYTRSAWRARELWRELETEAGTELFRECGVAWFAHAEDGWEAASERILRDEEIPVERLPPDHGGRLFPSFEAGDLAFILWEPNAGILRAADATRAMTTSAQEGGVKVVREAAEPGRLEGDAVVWACGAWLASLFPEIVPLRVTRQDSFYLDCGEAWSAGRVPAWVEYDERFPALAAAPLAFSKACPYSLTPDTHFLLAPHPELDGNWIFGGGSGHGFKHGPALAEYAARVIAGGETPDERFGLGPRETGPSLRTAGLT